MNRHWSRKALLLLVMTQRRTQRCLAWSRYRQAMEMESAIAAHPSLCLARSTSLTDSTPVGIPYRGGVVESSHGRVGQKSSPNGSRYVRPANLSRMQFRSFIFPKCTGLAHFRKASNQPAAQVMQVAAVGPHRAMRGVGGLQKSRTVPTPDRLSSFPSSLTENKTKKMTKRGAMYD